MEKNGSENKKFRKLKRDFGGNTTKKCLIMKERKIETNKKVQ